MPAGYQPLSEGGFIEINDNSIWSTDVYSCVF